MTGVRKRLGYCLAAMPTAQPGIGPPTPAGAAFHATAPARARRAAPLRARLKTTHGVPNQTPKPSWP
eukprot:2650319-Lingulodinium_polyedra.AAC.1